jgi:hypothetical protein
VCQRIYEREFYYLEYLLGFIGAAVIGCPILAVVIRCCITCRCCGHRYPDTYGVTFMELIFRGLCSCCCKFSETNRKPGADDFLGGDGEEGEGGEGENQQREDKIQVPHEFADAKPGSAGDEGLGGFDEENRALIK